MGLRVQGLGFRVGPSGARLTPLLPQTSQRSPLFIASRDGHLQAVKILLEHRASVDLLAKVFRVKEFKGLGFRVWGLGFRV